MSTINSLEKLINDRGFRIGNAAGTCNTFERPEHFGKLLKSAADIITIGPMSVLPRAKNPGNNAYRNAEGGTINSMGLPGFGDDWFFKNISWMIAATKGVGKTLALTVPPIHENDETTLAEACVQLLVPIVEINAGCNHVFIDGVQKLPASYFPERLERIISTFVRIAGRSCRLRIKLSPYFPIVPPEVADVIRPYDIDIVSCNTGGNAFMFTEDFRPAIEFGKHLGGYGGKGMKPIALGNIVQLREMLPNHRIIGVSGISNGRDGWEFLKVGANEIQIGSEWYFSENARIFGDVPAELGNILEAHPL